jgi:DNA-binding IclR family transcriptional regulator
MEQDKLPVLTDRYIVILRAVDKLGNSRLTEIADEIEQYPSNVHRALQEMVDWDLVIREDSDEIRYSLTGLGVKSIQEF